MKLFATLMVLVSTIAIAANGDLTGKIVNKKEEPISNAVVRILGTDLTTKTDDNGQFVFDDLTMDTYKLDVEISNSKHYNLNISHDGEPVIVNVDKLRLDNVVVSANPLEHNQLKMTTPSAILDEEELITNRELSIDQALNGVTGVNSGSFGVGAGQIVIRGQQGPRVTVLNNGILTQDASRVSPDHWITNEMLLAKQIEVLKGPATLLYGGGAIGGVVNVVDDMIPTQSVDGLEGGVEFRLSDNALDEKAAVLSLNGGITDRLVAHFSYYNNETDDYEIPGEAESRILMEAEGEEHDEEEEEGEEGVLENSSVDSDGYNVGFSYLTDNGYIGLSYSDSNRNYGIPGHGHEEEGHDDEEDGHDDDEEDGHDDEEEGHDEEEEVVRIDLDKTVFNLKGLHRFSGDGFVREIKGHFSSTDYRHLENEGDEIGTIYDNEAHELRLEMTHGTIGGFEGVWGFQSTKRDFSALGEEAYLLPTETKINSIFFIEERDFDNWHAEFGLRYDDQNIESAIFNDVNDSALSISLGATFNLDNNWTLPVNIASAQRLPFAEELFSNQSGGDELVPHLATSAIEIGDPTLEHETANNLDIGLRYRKDGVSFNVSVFYNKIDDFIYLMATGDEEEGFPVFRYTQRNAEFKGFEIDYGYEFETSNGHFWDLGLFADSTSAKLNNNERVPRIPARRMGANAKWAYGPWSARIDYTHVDEQDDVAAFELPTEGYDLLNLSANWVHYGSSFDTMIFIRAKNLLDEEIRDHASFVKDLAPRPGRSISTGVRLTF